MDLIQAFSLKLNFGIEGSQARHSATADVGALHLDMIFNVEDQSVHPIDKIECGDLSHEEKVLVEETLSNFSDVF